MLINADMYTGIEIYPEERVSDGDVVEIGGVRAVFRVLP